jgi:hypothetical protein
MDAHSDGESRELQGYALLVDKGGPKLHETVTEGDPVMMSRLCGNVLVSARIKELKETIAERVVSSEIRRRSWRVQVLQQRLDGYLALSESRAKMYAESKSEGHRFQVYDREAELLALEEGCTVLELPPPMPPPGADWKDEPPPPPDEYPSLLHVESCAPQCSSRA